MNTEENRWGMTEVTSIKTGMNSVGKLSVVNVADHLKGKKSTSASHMRKSNGAVRITSRTARHVR
ncbi:MAG: hypothetical protein WAZ66_04945 [Enterococcus aquimarinus]